MLVLFLAGILLAGCGSILITGSGNVVTQEEAITGFDRVDISYSFEANISQGDTFSVVIHAEDNLVEYLQVIKLATRYRSASSPITPTYGAPPCKPRSPCPSWLGWI